MNVVGIIPCKSTSERVKNKNTRIVGGRQLYEWTRDAALKSRLTRTVIVTDDADTVRFGDADGIEMSCDGEVTVVVQAAAHHFADADALMLLNPTSPLRTTARINEAIAFLEAGTDSVVSVCHNGSSQFRWKRSPTCCDYDTTPPKMRTQDGPWYEENGAIYAVRADAFKLTGRLVAGHVALLVMDEWESIDIDTEHDLEVADWMLGREMFRRKPRVG